MNVSILRTTHNNNDNQDFSIEMIDNQQNYQEVRLQLLELNRTNKQANSDMKNEKKAKQ
jgi:hypothetical protein